MGKKPYFPFYPGDWIRDAVSGCSLAAQGLWLRMMIVAHDCSTYGELSVDGYPMPHQAIARRCGCSVEEFDSLFQELTHSGVPGRKSDGTIYSRRMVRDEKIRKIREKSGKKGGNPQLKNDGKTEELHVLVNQNPTTGLTTQLSDPLNMNMNMVLNKEESAKEKKKKRNTVHVGPNPAVKIFIDSFAKAFGEKFGQPYCVNGGKEGAIAARLLRSHPLEKLPEFQKSFFATEDEFLEKAGWTIGVFSARINKMAQGGKPEDAWKSKVKSLV